MRPHKMERILEYPKWLNKLCLSDFTENTFKEVLDEKELDLLIKMAGIWVW